MSESSFCDLCHHLVAAVVVDRDSGWRWNTCEAHRQLLTQHPSFQESAFLSRAVRGSLDRDQIKFRLQQRVRKAPAS